MNPLSFIFTEFLWRPLFNGLIWFYGALPFHDLGVAIILLTITIRMVLSPLLIRARKAQRELSLLQPEIKRLNERFKNDRGAQGKALMELYSSRKVNPFSGCLIMLVQLPILFALFQVFQQGFDPEMLRYLYSFVESPGALDVLGFGVIDLSKGNIALGALAAVVQYFQMRLMVPPPIPSTSSFDLNRIMQWQMPFVVLFISATLPSSLAVYWTASNLFDMVQEILLKKFSRMQRRESPH